MKRKKLFLLMIAFLLIGTSRVVGQEKSDAFMYQVLLRCRVS